ncbi:MAG TPA: hypothetical protein VGO62_07485, partial [Myxococcota bacterium]
MRAAVGGLGFAIAISLARCTCEPALVKPVYEDDAGVVDAGGRDAGPPDAGVVDAGIVDAGVLPDAGPQCDWGDNPP